MKNILKKARSVSRLPKLLDPSSSDTAVASVPSVPKLPSPDFIPYNPPLPEPPHSTSGKAHGLRKNKKSQDHPPPVPLKDGEIMLDKNLDNMDGIIDFNIRYGTNGLYEGLPDSPSSGFESSVGSSALSSDFSSSTNHQAHASTTSLPTVPLGIFRDPFHTPSNNPKRSRRPGTHDNIISPTTKGPYASVPTLRGGLNNSPWMAPESWAVEKGLDDEALSEDSSSDGEDTRRHRRRRDTTSTGKTMSRYDDRDDPYRLRIYRRDNTYHVATIPLKATVSDLLPYLDRKMLHDTNREMHRLYLKERGRGLLRFMRYAEILLICICL